MGDDMNIWHGAGSWRRGKTLMALTLNELARLEASPRGVVPSFVGAARPMVEWRRAFRRY
jgi:hypothetical protein